MSLVVWRQPVPQYQFEADDFHEAQKKALHWLKQGGSTEWKVNRRLPGNGVTRKSWVCNSHKKCPVVVRLSKAWGEQWQLFIQGTHALEPQERRRLNSPFTLKQEHDMTRSLNEGATPGKVLASMTMEKEKEYKKLGIDPLSMKRKEGGLKGASGQRHASRQSVCVCGVGSLGCRWM